MESLKHKKVTSVNFLYFWLHREHFEILKVVNKWIYGRMISKTWKGHLMLSFEIKRNNPRVKQEERLLFQVHLKAQKEITQKFSSLFWNGHSFKSFNFFRQNCHILLDIWFNAIFNRFWEGFLKRRILRNSRIFRSDIHGRFSRSVFSCNRQI